MVFEKILKLFWVLFKEKKKWGNKGIVFLERVWQQKERIFCGLVEPLTMKRASCCVCADEDKDEGAEKGKKIGLRICGF